MLILHDYNHERRFKFVNPFGPPKAVVAHYSDDTEHLTTKDHTSEREELRQDRETEWVQEFRRALASSNNPPECTCEFEEEDLVELKTFNGDIVKHIHLVEPNPECLVHGNKLW